MATSVTFFPLLYWLLIFVSSVKNEIRTHRGHYPPAYCELTDVILRVEDRKFYYKSSNDGDIRKCTGVVDVWPLEAAIMFDDLKAECSVSFEIGHIFTVYYYYGSNYFHLHYDMLIPLYLGLYHNGEDHRSHLLLPTVETTRLQAMDWNTPAFANDSKYWVQMIKVLVGSHTYLPLDNRPENRKLTACFEKAYFGTPSVDYSDKRVIQGFVQRIQETLNVTVETFVKHRIGIITRSRNRRILNEEELLAAVAAVSPTDRIEFTGMTFRDQIALMQTYTVLIGMNGAGLTNGLYLPPGGVVIQLVPSKLQLNNREFGRLLQGGGGGGYLEWINTQENKTVNHGGDTIVDVDEIVKLALQAVSMYDNSHRQNFPKEL